MKTDDKDLLAKIYGRWMEAFTEEMQGWANNLSREAMDPAKLMELVKQIGIDFSSLAGMAGGKSGFDPYQILGLDKSASDDEVKKRYRELVNKLHPDKSGTPGTSPLFQIVLAAYEVIKKERGLS